MFGLLDYLKLAAGGAAGAVILYGWAVIWHGPSQYRAGQASERSAAIERANDLIKKMEQDNAEISGMDDSGICAEFGFKWMPDRGCY